MAWCTRMVVAPKKDGFPRRKVDLQKLNAASMRETYHTPFPFNQVSLIKKTVLNVWNGYHSFLLSPTSQDTTTFFTEWGWYHYLRAPIGFHASGDRYTHQIDDIIVDTLRKIHCIDIPSSGMTTWNQHSDTVKYISQCGKNGSLPSWQIPCC